jgi:hypothetical protein
LNKDKALFSCLIGKYLREFIIAFVFMSLSLNSVLFAEPPVADATPESPQFFFDAKSTGFSKDGGQQIFDGDVIAIGPKSLVTADKIIIDEKNRNIIAEGHVVILSNGQYITGDRVELKSDTGDLKVTSAHLVINDATESDRIAQEVLGYTPSEIEFESHRQKRLKEIALKKDELRSNARSNAKQGLTVSDESIRTYGRYLEQEDLITKQENPAFAQMSEARRNTLKKRRNFWLQSRSGNNPAAKPERAAYFRLSGESVERTNGNDLFARDGVWTPCYCALDEMPAWALRSSEISAQPGGYASFKNAILEIKGVPVLYLPWFKVPIKDRRQSGLLMPIFSSDSQSGSVYSQPLYIDLGANKDVTIKSELFEKRGAKLALETRYLRKKHSGFTLSGEVMKDRLWLAQKNRRDELREVYLSGLETARSDNSGEGVSSLSGYRGKDYAVRRLRQRSYWESTRPDCLSSDAALREACEDNLKQALRSPKNTHRGTLKWSGQERLSDRLSFVSNGEYLSDRQYISDLYIPDGFEAGFDTRSGEPAIPSTKAQFHYGQRDYYLGLGTSYGDYVLSNDRYEGYQAPAILKARSRLFKLGNSRIPVYGSASVDQFRLLKVSGQSSDSSTLGSRTPSAWWRRFQGGIVAPVSSRSAVQIDHFTEVEGRVISFDKGTKPYSPSNIQSFKSGFRFQLPIDGKAPMPSWMGTATPTDEEARRYIQHVMNLSLTLTARPSVVRRGPYGTPGDVLDEPNPGYYMATDSEGIDENINPEDYMNPYQLMTFETSHRWKVFNQVWRKTPGESPDDPSNPSKIPSWEVKARRELLYSLDQPVRSEGDMFSNDQSKWFINRYQLLNTDYLEPVSFVGNISYDYLKETKRREERKNGSVSIATRPWSEPTGSLSISAYEWTLSDTSKYNIYDRIATKHAIGLTPPGFFRTNVSFGYTLEQNAVAEDENRKLVYKPVREKTLSVVTSLTNPVTATYSWGSKDERNVDIQYRQKLGLVFGSDSRCWGLSFSREKPYGVDEYDATYLLQLSIVFMGQSRDLPNMSDSITRELKKS